MKRMLVVGMVLAVTVPLGARADLPGPVELAGRTGDGFTLAMSFDTLEDHNHFMVDVVHLPVSSIPMGLDGTIHVVAYLIEEEGLREIHFGDDHTGSMSFVDPPVFDRSIVRFGLPGGFDTDAMVDVCLGMVEYAALPGAACPGAAGFFNGLKGGPLYLDLDAIPEIVRLA